MSRVACSTIGHDGTCGFCGTQVDRSYITCTGCGATWRTAVTGWGHNLVQASWMLAGVVGAVVGLVAESPVAFLIVWLGLTFLFAWRGLSMQVWGWAR